jgi:hypothetical protein
MQPPKSTSRRVLKVLAIALTLNVATTQAATDLTTGNAAAGVVSPALNPVLNQTWGPGDASLIFRALTMVGNAWFDAIAPYHATAVGVYSNLGRRPEAERLDNLGRNTALMYASYQVLNSLFPTKASTWRTMMTSVGLDPNDRQRNTDTAVGIGNMAGDAVVAARTSDGMNQLGNEGGCRFNCLPYADYLGYKPVNTAYELVDASRWQPDIKSSGNGIFTIQQFVTPQYRVTRPYSYTDPNNFTVPRPDSSDPSNFTAYKAQMDEVLAASAALNDQSKMNAELFDNKYRAFGGVSGHIISKKRATLDQYVQYYFLSNMAAFDTGIAVWNEKYRYDSVRPYSAVDYIYGSNPVTAYGGPGKGTISNLPGNQWRSYLNVADHPEYPSGSASFCHAFAESSRRYWGSDDLGWSITFPARSSKFEPGMTPAADVVLTFATWTDWVENCKQARVDGGVHFRAAVDAAYLLGDPIGDLAYDFLMAHVNGQAQ